MISGDVDEHEHGVPNLILAQFEKVTRSKSTWKCTLKEGIMNLNGKDYIFNKAKANYSCETK